jgi:hypothetical protein
MLEQIFINFVPEDFPHLEEIKKRLELAGLRYYLPPADDNPVNQHAIVEKIKEIAGSHGCMLCILSNQAVSNSLFIGNIQLMCETARSSRVLIEYLIEDLGNDQSIRLFASQAYQVKRSRQSSEDGTDIIKRINQVIHPPARNVFKFLLRYISGKALIRLFIAVLVLGVGGSILFNVLQPAPSEPNLPTPTPVVMFVPFSGQSQDAGLIVDARSVPDCIPETVPVLEAPFLFHPATILDHQEFSDPAFEHTYDTRKWLFSYMLDDVSSVAVTQTNGVLQMAVAPIGGQALSIGLNSKYLFNLEQLSYLGFRFRLDDYQGRVQDATIFRSAFSMVPGEAVTNLDISINGISQILSNEHDISLGSRWHTVEMLGQPDKHFMDLYLDGKKIRTISFTDDQLVLWRHYGFSMLVSNTSDWVRIQIDEVIFGADRPIPQTIRPEDASYRFTPDTVALHEGFETSALDQALVDGAGFVSQSQGVVSFRIPAGKDNPGIQFRYPGKPISENNYYAARFRFTSPDDNYWANWASLYIGLVNLTFQSQGGFNLYLGSMRQELNFQGHSGSNNVTNAFAYNQNAAPGNWHTLEMIIEPVTAGSLDYTVSYWVDGGLLGRSNLQDSAPFLDASAPLVAVIQINSGSNRQNVFSGDIDDLVIGAISADKIKE